MLIVNTLSALRAQLSAWKQQGLTIGFVPTMGNLHAGHLSLVDIAKQKADKVIVSIFVNPLQFGPNEDLASYPRTYEADVVQLQQAENDLLFFPTVEEMYPNGQQQTKVCVPLFLTGLLEGASRPGHFDGVSTVVTKLFNMVQPNLAVFGQKDYQQLKVIQMLVRDLAMPIDIIRAPIGRAEDGLALSSRNQYLTPEQRLIAPKLFVTLNDVALAIQSGNYDIDRLERTATEQLLLLGFDAVDYVKVVDAQTLLPVADNLKATLEKGQNHPGLVILAVARLGKTRLLDNILLED